MALEAFNDIPAQDFIIYIHGSKKDTDSVGRDISSNISGGDIS